MTTTQRRTPRTPHTPQSKIPPKKAVPPAPDPHSHPRYSIEHVINAIRAAKGMISPAAGMLGCDRGTLYDQAKRHPEVQKVIEEEREAILDIAELALVKAVERGEVPAIKFILKCLGRGRGYVEKSDVVVSGGVSLADLINGSVEEETQQKRG